MLPESFFSTVQHQADKENAKVWCEAGLEWKTSVSDWHLVQENEDKVTQRKVWFHVLVSREMLFHLQKVSSVYIPPPSKDFFQNFRKLFLCFTNCPPSTLVNSFAKVQAYSSPTCLCARKDVPSPLPRSVFCKRGLFKKSRASSLLLFV